MKTIYFSAICIIMMLLVAAVNNGYAQLKGTHTLGDFGLNAGTQVDPSIGVAIPFYIYDAKRYINSDGDKTGTSPDITTFLTGIGGSVVLGGNIFGAHYGASILIPFVKNRIEGNLVSTNSSLAFTDLYIQPVQLGWRLTRADFLFGYGLYIPTGKYTLGDDGNTGLGMWTNEFSVASTLYFNRAKTFNFSTIVFYATNSKKKGTDIKAGDILTLEGGLNKAFYKTLSSTTVPMVFNIGAIYYMQFKVTDDKIPVGQAMFSGSKDHIYAAGLEANVMYPKTFTALSFRWLGEFSAKNRFEGNTFFITLSQAIAAL